MEISNRGMIKPNTDGKKTLSAHNGKLTSILAVLFIAAIVTTSFINFSDRDDGGQTLSGVGDQLISPEEMVYGDMIYKILKEPGRGAPGAVILTNGHLLPGDTADIPKMIMDNRGREYYVTVIGESAFEGMYGLTSITIPDSVTAIEAYAFYNVQSPASLTIPASVTYIGAFAFAYADIEIITMPMHLINNGSIGLYAVTEGTMLLHYEGAWSVTAVKDGDEIRLTDIITYPGDKAVSLYVETYYSEHEVYSGKAWAFTHQGPSQDYRVMILCDNDAGTIVPTIHQDAGAGFWWALIPAATLFALIGAGLVWKRMAVNDHE